MTTALSPATSPPLLAPAGTAGLGLLSLNVFKYQTARTEVADWIAGQDDADVVVLSGLLPGRAGDALADALHAHGYTILRHKAGASADTRMLIADRTGDVELLPRWTLPGQVHRTLLARISLLGVDPIGLVGLHSPGRRQGHDHSAERTQYHNRVGDYLRDLPATFGAMPVLVVGDLQAVDSRHERLPRQHGRHDSTLYTFHRDVLDGGGLVDVYRHLHPTRTALSHVGASGTASRIDHMLLTAGHADLIGRVTYLHSPRIARLTDHAAMTVRLHLPITPTAGQPTEPERIPAS